MFKTNSSSGRSVRQSRKVTMLQIYEWGDGKTPSHNNYAHLRELLDIMEKVHENDGTPIVVHCSAGVGRTGCVIALDQICRLLKKIKQKFPDLKNQDSSLGVAS